MDLLIDIFGFLSVILSGLEVTAQSLTVGGIVFLAAVALPFSPSLAEAGPIISRRTRSMIRWSALGLLAVDVVRIVIEVAILVDTTGITTANALGAQFAVAHIALIALALLIIQQSGKGGAGVLGIAAALVLVATTLTTHAPARIDDRLELTIATGFHQAGAATWIGGIPYFIMALATLREAGGWALVGKRFSQMSMASVTVIFFSGLFMSLAYIAEPAALYGTAYGVMVSTKVMLFGALLLFGYANFRTVERLRANSGTSILHMRRFAEVEIGVGITIFFAAASLTSLPPASDLVNDRVTFHEILDRNIPNAWPRLASPSHDDLALPALQSKLDEEARHMNAETTPRAFIPGSGDLPPRNANDIAWSEYNHHWSGMIVVAIGLLALLERSGRARWARNWPLMFLVLGFFLFIRSDPETWPLGNIGFFESLRDPEVVQHRLFLLVIFCFAIFEWGVRTGRIKDPRAPYVFPIVTALGGMMLLTHSHAISNIKEQLLIEITHVPLALAGIAAGWARWLELRLEPRDQSLPALIWPICFVICGVVLLIYREA